MKTLAQRLVEGFDMTSEPPKTLDQVYQQNNSNMHGEYFTSEVSDGTFYFLPVTIQKNGKLQGAFFSYYGSIAGKATPFGMDKSHFSRYKHIEKSKVPPKIKAKLDAKAGELYKKLSD